MNNRLLKFKPAFIALVLFIFLWLGLSRNASSHSSIHVAGPGLPFIEDFASTTFRDANLTNANWSTDESALLLAWQDAQYGAFGSTSGSDISDSERRTYSTALGDVDGDGNPDLIAGNYHQRIRLYLNNGSVDPFAGVSGSDISVDDHYTTSLALGDLDGDGDLDLVAGNAGQPNRLYLNNGTADPFAGVSGGDISADTQETRSVALGDMNGDGALDLVVGQYQQTNRLYLNNGTDDPFNGVNGRDISADTLLTAQVALGDLDGDGDLDLMTGTTGLYQVIRMYLNNGTNDPFNGISGKDIDDAYELPLVTLGDVNRDGDLDLIAGSFFGPNRLYLNNGSADPFNGIQGTNISEDDNDTLSLTLGDVDGDGNLDLITGNYRQRIRLYLNNGTDDPFDGVSGSNISADTHETRSVVLGDLDGDADLDLVAGNSDHANRQYLNNGTADPFNANPGIDISDDAHKTESVAPGDIDGDGDLDIVVGNNGSTNRLYLNNGTADPFKSVTGSDVGANGAATLSVALGDVDADGDLDLVTGNYNYYNRLYLNNGTVDPFSGVSGSNINYDVYKTRSVALGDVDSDGDLDLITGNDGFPNRVYLNNGSADPFIGVSGSDISVDDHKTTSVALADLDGDGNLDLVAGNSGQTNRLYLNNGTADPFAGVSGSDISADAQETWSVALGDMNGDGALDLVVGQYEQPNRLYLNNGTDNPFNGVSGSNTSDDIHTTRSVVLGDVDGDGDLDLVAGNSREVNRLVLNNGTADPFNGVFGIDVSSDFAQLTNSMVFGDLDGDGDLDLVTGNYGPPTRFYFNNSSADPSSEVRGSDINTDASATTSMSLGSMDGDLNLVSVNDGHNETNRLYERELYHTGQGRAFSLNVNANTDNISAAILAPTHSLPPNTWITYWLSNNGGSQWFIVYPGVPFIFPTTGSDLRWRAELHSFSPALTPRIEQIMISVPHQVYLPLVLSGD
ncbi:MAG TPA: VCBS repeat-containing protein [candidate division Zixibacteria bacterium]|nr:VCBS repeat-containing protein [candidate division Zixibacteria bacterium]